MDKIYKITKKIIFNHAKHIKCTFLLDKKQKYVMIFV